VYLATWADHRSARRLEPLLKVLAELPEDFPHGVLVVAHLPARGHSVLADILERHCSLHVLEARDAEVMRAGHVYVALPDFHLTAHGPAISLTSGPQENSVRPAMDRCGRSPRRQARRRCSARPRSAPGSPAWAEDVWGLRQDEAVDHHLLSLDIGLPTEQLAPALRAALGGGERQDVELEAIDRRGRTIVCRTTVMPLLDGDSDGDQPVRGAIVLMSDEPDGADGGRRGS
jgi:hypothetical protein